MKNEIELERYLRLEKVVASKQLRLAAETEEERRARLENDAATKRLRLAMEMDGQRKKSKTGEDGSYMLALIKYVVNVGVVLSLKPILKSWQLCLSFKLDVHRHPQLKKYDHELLSASLILLYIYLITYLIMYHFNKKHYH